MQRRNPGSISRMLEQEGLGVVSLVRGGFFASVDQMKRKEAIDENLRAMEEAAALRAPLHPMYADTRSAISSLKQANDLVELIGSDHRSI